MKEQILPALPIVGLLKLKSRDGKSVCDIEVVYESGTDELDPFFAYCYQEFWHYLTGRKTHIDIPLDFSGLSPFQQQVLAEMAKIPYGKVQSYRDLAQRMDSKAYQAIGGACGRNPFLLIYPCHRVVGSHDMGGFAHGPEMKLSLLELEARHTRA
jgi:O-6-methylguanine DNA methyltransferase